MILAIWIAQGSSPFVNCSRPIVHSCLECYSGSDRSHTIYDRECSGDRVNPAQDLQVTGGSTFRRVIFILIESGMALFSIQLARLLVIGAVGLSATHNAPYAAFLLIIGMHEILNVITRSVIAVLFY